jgi:predicted KAP-like P-loop ATPase
MNTDTNDYLFSDKPLDDPSKDMLGRATLAENLAKGLLKMAPPEGFVVAIFGPWGSGKSTLLTFIRHFLEKTPEADRPIIVEFNPWWFSGREDLTISFFSQLSVAIDDGTAEVEEIRRLIADFAELVSHYPHWTTQVGGVIAKWFAWQKRSVPKLKSELGQRLLRNGKRVIVLIDDVDRLIPAEILDLFRLVKAVADFPNVLYLMAFEREAVANAITAAAGSKITSYGDSYLEKIVQLPVELPMPDRISIQGMFAQQLSVILPEKLASPFDKDRLREVYLEGIDHFLRTPRDVQRLANALKLTVPMVEGEVNRVDFIALEALRIFRPSIYDVIRFHSEQFTGPTPSEDLENLTAFHNTWMQELREDQKGPLAHILNNIFPKFESAFRNVTHEESEDWRRSLRACSPEKFPVYFGLAVPLGDITRAELDLLAASSADPAQFGEALLNLLNQRRPDGRTRVCQALEQLADSEASIFPQDAVPNAIRGLLNVGDELVKVEDATGLWVPRSNRDRVLRLVWQLLRRLSAAQRLDLLKDSVESGEALSTIVDIVATLGDAHGKYSGRPLPQEVRLVEAEDLPALEQAAAQRIVDASKTGALLATPRFVHVLYAWKDWSGEETVANWLQDFLSHDDNFLFFLRKRIPDDEIRSGEDAISDLKGRQYLDRIKDFIKIEDYADRIEALSRRNDLTEKDKIRLKLIALDREKQQIR